MGKSAAAEHFAQRGVPVFDADAEVHRLYEGEAVEAIEAAFPRRCARRQGRPHAALRAIAGSPERLRAARGDRASRWWSRPRSISCASRRGRAPSSPCWRSRCCSRPTPHARVDVTVVVSAPETVQRRPRAGAARHDRGQARTSACAATARRREARPRRLRCGQRLALLHDMHDEIDRLLESLRGRKGR